MSDTPDLKAGQAVATTGRVPRNRGPHDATVACYTFPHWHRSALSDRLYGPGWNEYVVMRSCAPWFDGHEQPRVPLLGELDEREPATWERYIDLAADHGVDAFIWDAYWYDGEPAFHEALEDGFLRAPNRDRVRFAVMWVNHAWTRVRPTVHTDGSDSWEHAFTAPDETIEDVWRSLSYLLARYLHHPRYWTIAGRPFVAVWHADSLLRQFGVDGTRELFGDLRALAQRMGHSGLHLHAVFGRDMYHELEAMGFDSYDLYNPLAMAAGARPAAEQLPQYSAVVADVVQKVWPDADARSRLPFLPTVSPGWDTAPRFLRPRQRHGSERDAWPGTTYWGDPMMVVDETPSAFGAFVEAALRFVHERPDHPGVITVGCWNEWTEGAYLLPDTRFGYGMLSALAEALMGRSRRSTRDWTYGTLGSGLRPTIDS